MAKRTKKQSKSRLLKVEALEARQLLAGGFTAAQGQEFSDITHPNGNVYDQVLMKTSAITVTADAGQVTRVSFLDLQGDIVQAEFSGAGSLSISLDNFTGPAAPTKYIQPGIQYVSGLATFTVQGADSTTNFSVFSVGSATALNQTLFDTTHTGGDNFATVQRLAIVANPNNPNGSTFGGINAGNAVFTGSSGVVGISAANVQVQSAVKIADLDATGTANPTLIFGTASQFGDILVTGGDLIQTNGKAINDTGSYHYGIQLVAGTTSSGAADAAENSYSQLTFTDYNPVTSQLAKTLTLSTTTDTGSALTGTTGDDTYLATIGSNGLTTNGTTLNPGDSLTGGAGTDTLSLSVSGTNSAGVDQTTASWSSNGIEKLTIANFQSEDTSDTVVDMSNVTGLQSVAVTASASSGDTKLTNLQNLVTATIGSGSGDLNLGYVSSVVSGSADAQSLTLARQTGGTFTTNGVEITNIASTSASNTITLGSTSVTTVNVSGDQSLALGTLPSGVTKVTSTATAGALTLTAASGKNYNLVGGAGNDTFSLTGTEFTASDSIDGGAGNDTLSIGLTGAVDQSLFTNVSNVETIKLTGAANVTLASNIGATRFDLSDTNSAKTLTLSAATLTTSYTNATTVILGNKAGQTVTNLADATLTVTANAGTMATQVIAGGAGTDTVTLASDTSTVTWSATSITGVETVNITGSNTVDITTNDANIASAKTLTVAAGSASGNIKFSAAAETNGYLNITTGSGADTIIGGAYSGSKDSISSGSGNDLVQVANLNANMVVNGGTGTDVLDYTGTTAISSAAAFTGVSGVETLKLSATSNLTLAAPIGITTLDLTTPGTNHVVTLSSGFTDALTVNLTGVGANTDNIVNTSANTALTVNANVTDITAATSVAGGSGTDILNITAGTGTATLTKVSGVETINVLANATTPTQSATLAMGAVDTLIGTGKTLKVDASALTSANFTFTGSTSETDGFLSVIGGGGNDTISGGNSGFDTLIGGAGNDTLTVNNISATSVVQGGTGTDTLVVTGTSIASASSLLGVTGVEVLKLSGAINATFASNIASATGITTIATDQATSANTITFNPGFTDAANVDITGDTGNNDAIVNAANVSLTVTGNMSNLGSAVTVTGGTGTDVISLTSDAGTANLTKVTGVEQVNITGSNTGTVTLGGVDTVVASGKTLTIDASAASGAISFIGTGETNGFLVMKGGSTGDRFVGGGAQDTFTGGAGADVFVASTHGSKFTFDTIADVATGDIIEGGGANAGSFNATKITLSQFATFADYLDQAAAGGGAAATPIYSWFQYGGNTYVVVDHGAGATYDFTTDSVVEISGTKTIAATTSNTVVAGIGGNTGVSQLTLTIS